jgi:hypothetical protein
MNTQTTISCAWCGGRVPPEYTPEVLAAANDAPAVAMQMVTGLVNSFGQGDMLVWCSGKCCRQTFLAALRELVRTALTPREYDALCDGAPPEVIRPASLPELTTTNHIREAIEQVSAHLLANRVTPKQASLLLYAIQTALGVLRIATEREAPPEPHTNAIGFANEGEEPTCSSAAASAAPKSKAAPGRNSTAESSAASATTAPPPSRSSNPQKKAASKSRR